MGIGDVYRYSSTDYGDLICQYQLEDYPHLIAYTRDLYQHKNVAALVDLEHTKLHYFGSFLSLSPQGLVPLGKVYDFSVPPNRAQAWEEAADVAA